MYLTGIMLLSHKILIVDRNLEHKLNMEMLVLFMFIHNKFLIFSLEMIIQVSSFL